jgi:hypothetical protein
MPDVQLPKAIHWIGRAAGCVVLVLAAYIFYRSLYAPGLVSGSNHYVLTISRRAVAVGQLEYLTVIGLTVSGLIGTAIYLIAYFTAHFDQRRSRQL